MTARHIARHRSLDFARPVWRAVARTVVLGLAATLVMVPALLLAPPASAAIVEGNETTSATTNYGRWVSPERTGYFQSFTPTKTGTLVAFTILTQTLGVGTMEAELQQVNAQGMATGPVLGTYSGQIPDAFDPAGATVLSGSAVVVAGKQYVMTVSAVTGFDDHSLFILPAVSNAYPGGSAGLDSDFFA